MASNHKQHPSIQDALAAVNQLVKEAKQQGIQLLGLDVGAHINPGDVYDAYEASGLKPSMGQEVQADTCGPLAAVIIDRYEELNASNWRDGVRHFNPQYVRGFEDGFARIVPSQRDGDSANWPYLRGVYDGVMAHAAVF